MLILQEPEYSAYGNSLYYSSNFSVHLKVYQNKKLKKKEYSNRMTPWELYVHRLVNARLQ